VAVLMSAWSTSDEAGEDHISVPETVSVAMEMAALPNWAWVFDQLPKYVSQRFE